MPLEQVQIHNLRILTHVEFEPTEHLNFIIGPNASGKTSILEAIYLLSVARSFRTRRARDLVQRGATELTVRGAVTDALGGSTRIAIQKNGAGTRLSIGGKRAQSSSALAGYLPLITLTPDSHVLLHGGPKERRRLLDWTLFHVKPDYLLNWHSYHRALKQRNRLLQGSAAAGAELSAWESEMSLYGDKLHLARQTCVDELTQVAAVNADYLGVGQMGMEYRPGWDANRDLREAIEASRPADLADGRSRVGPHRADIRLTHDGQLAANKLSRGQSKLLIAALYAAQASRLAAQMDKRPTLLIDDFAAELDEQSKSRLAGLIGEIAVQTFVTATDSSVLPSGQFEPQRTFHVEQGRVETVL